MIRISCVIPCYKRIEQTLQTIDLLFHSKGWGVEYEAEIIVADSTPDTSLEVALEKKFGKKIKYVHPPRVGIAVNKNYGAKEASGDILIFCDSDIEVEEDTLPKTLEALKKNPQAAMVGGTVLWKGGENDGQIDRPDKTDAIYSVNDTFFIEALYSRYIATYKAIFEQLGGYDDEAFNMRGEGSDLSTRYWRAGYPLILEKEIVVHHVYDAPDSAAIRIAHREFAIAKDFYLLAYKFNMDLSRCDHFSDVLKSYFESLPGNGYSALLQGIVGHQKFISLVTPSLIQFKENDTPLYDFKFLEIFSQTEMTNDCLTKSESKLVGFYTSVFPKH